ncbi:MAG TPA: T9SS type A sorting domain-containing protein [Bacteroidales bacterium]|nr:T9SS type A sorting domain-containing protein [Bacteroidales bacterium]
MKNKSLFLLFLLTILSIETVKSQTEILKRIGQTPGGAAHHVNWIEDQQKLIVGCGGSLWVYDMQNPAEPVIVAKRAFMQLIQATDLYGDILFAAAESDGLYALDFTSDSLTILDLYSPLTFQYTGQPQSIFDFSRSYDTLFVPVYSDFYKSVRVVTYNQEDGFTELYDYNFQLGISPAVKNGARCISINDKYIAVGKQKMPLEIFQKGEIYIFNRYYPYNKICSYEDSLLNKVQRLKFADLNEDILFACAGSTNAGLSSHFFAFHIDENNIIPVDTFSIGLGGIGLGLPIVSAVNITNMDSRNDTIFLATTCWVDTDNYQAGENFSFIPVLDATNLPEQPMSYDAHFYGGLWHFDVALMHGTPYMAIASEWLGLLISDITNFDNPLDTLLMTSTGGWIHNTETTGDTLWVASEGWGLAVYKTDSLLFENGYNTDAMIMHKYQAYPGHYFVSDFEFINDTLLYLSSGHVFNLKNWFTGGETEFVSQENMGAFITKMVKIRTNLGTRFVLGKGVWLLSDLEMGFFNPETGEVFGDDILLNNEPTAFDVSDDVLFYPYRTLPYLQQGDVHIVAAKIENDELTILEDMLFKTNTIDIVGAVDAEENIVVIGSGATFTWYEWTGEEFVIINSFTHSNTAQMASGVKIKNNLLYASYRYDGLKVIDMNDGTELAYFKGSGGYDGIGGSGNSIVNVGNDGKIYLSDFYSGVFIINAYDLTINIQNEFSKMPVENEFFTVYPNPATDEFTILLNDKTGNDKTAIKITDITGKEIISNIKIENDVITIQTEKWQSGIYFISITQNNKILKTERIIIN